MAAYNYLIILSDSDDEGPPVQPLARAAPVVPPVPPVPALPLDPPIIVLDPPDDPVPPAPLDPVAPMDLPVPPIPVDPPIPPASPEPAPIPVVHEDDSDSDMDLSIDSEEEEEEEDDDEINGDDEDDEIDGADEDMADAANPGVPLWEESVPFEIGYGSVSSTRDDADSQTPVLDTATTSASRSPLVVPSETLSVPPLAEDPVPQPITGVTHIPLAPVSPVQSSTSPTRSFPSRDREPPSTMSILDPVPTVGVITRVRIPVLRARPTTPSHRSYRLDPHGTSFGYTQRKRVSLPITSDDTVPIRERCGRRRSDARRWEWLHDTIREWREEEGAPPSTYEVGESSYAPRPVPATGEPVERTIPLVIARLSRHELTMDQMSDDIERSDRARGELDERFGLFEDEIRGDVVEMDKAHQTLIGRVDSLEENQEEIDDAHCNDPKSLINRS